MKKYIDKSDVDGLVQIGWSGDAIVTAIINDGISSVPAIPLDKVKQAKEEIEQNAYPIVHGVNNHDMGMTLNGIFQVLDKLIESEEK